MSRLIFVTQLIDADDPVLGFVVPQLQALAARCDDLTVIANEVRSGADLGVRVISLGKEDGAGQLLRGARYQRALVTTIRQLRPAAIFAHMCPVYLSLAAPIARASRTPTMLWFVHSSNTRSLQYAEWCANAVVTAFPGSYPRQGPKVHPIGHAIDTDAFAWSPAEREGEGPLELLAVGRTSAYKGYETMIRAVGEVRASGVDVRLRIVGPSVTPSEVEYRAELERLVQPLDGDAVRIEDGVPRGAMPSLLREADVLVNASEARSADKVVFETMATGRPVVVSSPAFAPLLERMPVELSFPEGDADALAARLQALATTTSGARTEIGRELRDRVVREHSLDHWVSRVTELAEDLQHRRSRRVGVTP